MQEIIPGLFLGDVQDGMRPFDGFIFDVVEDPRHYLVISYVHRENTGWIPILLVVNGQIIASRYQLDVAADNIESAMQSHGKVLVHCNAGIERSPLTVAWFLYRKRGLSIDEAYALIISKRPQVQRRDYWLEASP